jgi:hypothetical protein
VVGVLFPAGVRSDLLAERLAWVARAASARWQRMIDGGPR